MQEIRVSLKPDDGPGNFEAVRRAIDEVRSLGGNSRVLLPAGRFPVWNSSGDVLFDDLLHGRRDPRDDDGWRRDRNPLIDLADCQDVVIEGEETQFELRGLVQPFSAFHSHGIVLKGLTIDYQRPPYTVGTIAAISGEDYEIEVGEFPVPEGAPVVAVHEHDPKAEHLTGICLYYNSAVRKLDGDRILMSHPKAGLLRVGNTVFLRHIYSFAPGLQFYGCREVLVEDVTLHAHAGMGIIGHLCHDLHVSRFAIRPSGHRVLSINVDGTHFISCTGTVTVEDSYFEGMGDDATNIHSFYLDVLARTGASSVRVRLEVSAQDFQPERPEPGDRIEFVHRATLAPFAEGEIANIETHPDGSFEIVFREILPDPLAAGDLLSDVSKLARFRFRRNTVKNIRGRAALIQTRDAIVEDCHFEFCTGQGVHVDTALNWRESAATRDVRILNNRMEHCGYGVGGYCRAAGVVVGTECEFPLPEVHRGLEIAGNRIIGSGDKPGLLISCANDVRVIGNDIQNCSTDISTEHCGKEFVTTNEIST